MIAMRWPAIVPTGPDTAERLAAARIRIVHGWPPASELMVAPGGPEKWTEHPPTAILRMGAFSYCQSFDDELSAAAVTIGRYCSIAHSVRRMGSVHPAEWVSTHPFAYAGDWFRDHAYYGYQRDDFVPARFDNSGAGVAIGNDVWIGEGVLVSGGVRIGDGAMLAARAVVTHDVPPYAIAAGVPARVRRYRFDEGTIRRLLAARWWRFHFSQFAGLPLYDPNRSLAGLYGGAPPERAEVRTDVERLLA